MLYNTLSSPEETLFMRKLAAAVLLACCAVSAAALHFTPQTALAQDKTLPAVFTVDTYIAAFLESSPRLKAQKNTLKSAQNTYKNAFTNAFLPSFSFGASADKTYNRYRRLSSWDDLNHADSSARAQGGWNLFNSGKDALAYKSASLDWQISQIEYEESVQNFVLEAVQTYYNLLLGEKLLKVYEDDLQVAQKQYEQDKVLYDNGLKTRSDLLSSETNFRSSQLSLFSAQSDYENALKNFNIALNLPVERPAKLDETISEDLPALPGLDQDLTAALAHRYDARTRRLRLRQSDVSQTLDNLNTLPSVFVDLFASTGRGFNSHELWEYNYGISAGISFDIGFFYLDKYRSRQNIRLSNENAHLEYEQFLRSLRDAVVEARNALLLKMRSLEISKLRLQAAEQKFEATQLKYKNGLMSATDLTVARQEMISAQVNYATLLSELTITRLRYQNALGNPIYDYNPEDL